MKLSRFISRLFSYIKKNQSIFFVLFFSLFFSFLFKVYLKRIGAFGCFDDCFNYVAAHFMLKGKALYSEIFFNHQMLMPYLSYVVQAISNPNTLYEFILYHRLSIFLFALFMNILIILRFRLMGVGFVLFYELTKYYVFGDRFLAEAVIVYPLVYLLGLFWYKLQKKNLSIFDFITSAVFTWFVIFMREPFIPVALLLYVLFLWDKKFVKAHYCSLFLFLVLSLPTVLSVSLPDYLFNAIEANFRITLPAQIKNEGIYGIGVLKIIAYPLFILFQGKWNYFRHILIGLDVALLCLIGFFIFRKKMVKEIGLLLLVLGLSNIRFVEPGVVYYSAFHMAPWYGLFIFTIFLLLGTLFNYEKKKKKLGYAFILVLAIVFGYILLSPRAFFYEKIDKDYEFTTNYANYFAYGEVIKLLSDPKDTLFVDGFDELIYWQAKLDSSYRYSWYTSFMPYFSKYSNERMQMFIKNPPIFYYGSCPKDKNASRQLPKDIINRYQKVYFSEEQTCLYIQKRKLSQIPKEKWEKVRKLGYHLLSED